MCEFCNPPADMNAAAFLRELNAVPSITDALNKLPREGTGIVVAAVAQAAKLSLEELGSTAANLFGVQFITIETGFTFGGCPFGVRGVSVMFGILTEPDGAGNLRLTTAALQNIQTAQRRFEDGTDAHQLTVSLAKHYVDDAVQHSRRLIQIAVTGMIAASPGGEQVIASVTQLARASHTVPTGPTRPTPPARPFSSLN